MLRGTLTRLIHAFFSLNRRVSARIGRYIPEVGPNLYEMYEDCVTRLMNSRPDLLVVDMGSGKRCPFAHRKDSSAHPKIIGLDVSYEEIASNFELDARVVADVVHGLPFGDSTVDLITSRAVLEHVKDVGLFVKDSARVLASQGYFVQVFPSKFAPFALINQMLPKSVSRKLIHFLAPEKKGECGFPAFYDRCYYSALRGLLESNGMEVVQVEVSYLQSAYFNFFAPAFILIRLYENLLQRFSTRNLCAYVLMIARKGGSASGESGRNPAAPNKR